MFNACPKKFGVYFSALTGMYTMSQGSRLQSSFIPRDSLLLRSRSRERSQFLGKALSRPATPTRSQVVNDPMKDKLITTIAEKRDLQRQLIGLKQVVEEFIVRLDFMLKCRASPETFIDDLRELGTELGLMMEEAQDTSALRTDIDRFQTTTELARLRHEADCLRLEKMKLEETVKSLEQSRIELIDSEKQKSDLDLLVSETKQELILKDEEVHSLRESHKLEIERMERLHEEKIIKLKNSLSASNRIIDRWKKIYHEDMLRLQGRIGASQSTVNSKQSS